MADLREAVDDGRIVPTVRVYQSEWNQMMVTSDPMSRLQMLDSMLERLAVPTLHYNERTARTQAMRDAVALEVQASMDTSNGTMSMDLKG